MMFPDLTQINVPYGLLDPETQEAMKDHSRSGCRDFEVWRDRLGWLPCGSPAWLQGDVYRVKSAPPQPRTIYLCEAPNGRFVFPTSIDATREALKWGEDRATVSEWREVL